MEVNPQYKGIAESAQTGALQPYFIDVKLDVFVCEHAVHSATTLSFILQAEQQPDRSLYSLQQLKKLAGHLDTDLKQEALISKGSSI